MLRSKMATVNIYAKTKNLPLILNHAITKSFAATQNRELTLNHLKLIGSARFFKKVRGV